MANTAHKDPEMVKEWEEDEESLQQKALTVAQWIKESKHLICFTGAGVSTSAGVPDFRGPQGVWTLRAQGKERTGPTTSTLKAIPTPTHMSIVALIKLGICKYLVSQNTDGLHRKSGVPPNQLSELHGNSNLEICKKCGKQYIRDFRVRSAAQTHDHKTERICSVPHCGGELHDSIINFGENLPEEPLHKALVQADKADLCISLGSSLTVSPAKDIPDMVSERGKLVIVNLQKTPLDDHATMKVHAKTDQFMKLVMKNLNLEIPEWRLRRRLQVSAVRSQKDDKRILDVAFQGVDIDGIPVTFLKHMEISTAEDSTKKKVLPSENDASILRYRKFLGRTSENLTHDNIQLQATLEFMGHYLEPSFVLNVKWSVPLDEEIPNKVFVLEYNPFQRTWTAMEDNDVSVKQETQENNNEPNSSWWQFWKN